MGLKLLQATGIFISAFLILCGILMFGVVLPLEHFGPAGLIPIGLLGCGIVIFWIAEEL